MLPRRWQFLLPSNSFGDFTTVSLTELPGWAEKARIRLSLEILRPFKGIICHDISEFEFHAVGLCQLICCGAPRDLERRGVGHVTSTSSRPGGRQPGRERQTMASVGRARNDAGGWTGGGDLAMARLPSGSFAPDTPEGSSPALGSPRGGALRCMTAWLTAPRRNVRAERVTSDRVQRAGATLCRVGNFEIGSKHENIAKALKARLSELTNRVVEIDRELRKLLERRAHRKGECDAKDP